MRKYDIILSDYDGTLANSDGLISNENLTAINEFIKRGGKFVVSSGRATDSISKMLKMQGFLGYVSSFNGGVLTNLASGETLYRIGIDYKVCIRFFNYLLEHNIYGHFYGESAYLYPFKSDYTERYAKLTGVVGREEPNIIDYIEETKKSSAKLLIFDEKYKLDKHFNELVKLLPECEVVRSTDEMIDINLKGVNKAKSIVEMAKIFNVKCSDVVAVGDAGNDIPMLEVAGLSVAPLNALEKVKAVANKITSVDNNNHAIKEVIEKYCI